MKLGDVPGRGWTLRPVCGILSEKGAGKMVLWLGHGDAYEVLAVMLGAEYGLSALPPVERDENGKPFFPEAPHIHFNLSHSGGLALCGTGDAPLGVDVEELRPRRPGLARHVLSGREYAWFQQQGGDWGAFYTLWTLKEARVKCTGRGLRQAPRTIAVPLLSPGEAGELDGLVFRAYSGETWRAAACCRAGENPPRKIVRIS